MLYRNLRYAFLAATLSALPWAPAATLRAETTANQLSSEESQAGWKLLFDGKTSKGWRNYRSDKISDGWKIVDGALVREGKGAGDIITDGKYKYFELSLEYKISEEGNSGLMFHVNEENGAPWQSGPEIQIQDNVKGHDPQKSGWLYQLYKPNPAPNSDSNEPIDATRPVGEWNQLVVRIAGDVCKVSMNGTEYYTFHLNNDDWKSRVAKSKFAEMKDFGNTGEGHICLQDHNDLVSYRNIKIRVLNDDGSVAK